MAKKQNIDAVFSELSKMLSDLENEKIPLENLEDHIKKATELLNFCETQLRTIQENVVKVSEE
jgi:exodeoxyribonuclease VII small subunit